MSVYVAIMGQHRTLIDICKMETFVFNSQPHEVDISHKIGAMRNNTAILSLPSANSIEASLFEKRASYSITQAAKTGIHAMAKVPKLVRKRKKTL